MMEVKNTKRRSERLGFRLDAEDKADLQEIANRRGCEISDAAREAVKLYNRHFRASSVGSQPTKLVSEGYGPNAQ